MYSSPPIHGAHLVSKILSSDALYNQWVNELKFMADRILEVRGLLKEGLYAKGHPAGSWDHITDQIGMFSFTGERFVMIGDIVAMIENQLEFFVKLYLLSRPRLPLTVGLRVIELEKNDTVASLCSAPFTMGVVHNGIGQHLLCVYRSKNCIILVACCPRYILQIRFLGFIMHSVSEQQLMWSSGQGAGLMLASNRARLRNSPETPVRIRSWAFLIISNK